MTATARDRVFEVAQPRRHGGYQTSMRTMLAVCSTVGEADGGETLLGREDQIAPLI